MGPVNILGANAWKGTQADATREGALTNVRNFVESIRSGKTIVNAEPAVQSTLTAILGRMAAYREKVMSWDEMLRVAEKLDPDLKM